MSLSLSLAYQNFSTKRIQKDLIECLSNPLKGIQIYLPLDGRLTKWIFSIPLYFPVNIPQHFQQSPSIQPLFQEQSLICFLYFSIEFPIDYPLSPPTVTLLTYDPIMRHNSIVIDNSALSPNNDVSNVIFESKLICLTMLSYPAPSKLKYAGWSEIYSVQSVLRQMQDFFNISSTTTLGILTSDYTYALRKNIQRFEINILHREYEEMEFRELLYEVPLLPHLHVSTTADTQSNFATASTSNNQQNHASITNGSIDITLRNAVPAILTITPTPGYASSFQAVAKHTSCPYLPPSSPLSPTSSWAQVAKNHTFFPVSTDDHHRANDSVISGNNHSGNVHSNRHLRFVSCKEVLPAVQKIWSSKLVDVLPLNCLIGRPISNVDVDVDVFTALTMASSATSSPGHHTANIMSTGSGNNSIHIPPSAVHSARRFGALPTATIHSILLLCTATDVINVISTGRFMYYVCCENSAVWSELVRRHFPASRLLPTSLTATDTATARMVASADTVSVVNKHTADSSHTSSAVLSASGGTTDASSRAQPAVGLRGTGFDWKHIFLMEVNNIQYAEIQCFVTKLSFREDILGIPLEYTYNPKTKKIDYINSSMDLLSKTAFYDLQCRHTVWYEPCAGWLPLFIDHAHFLKALPELIKIIVSLNEYKGKSSGSSVSISADRYNRAVSSSTNSTSSSIASSGHSSGRSSRGSSLSSSPRSPYTRYNALDVTSSHGSGRAPAAGARGVTALRRGVSDSSQASTTSVGRVSYSRTSSSSTYMSSHANSNRTTTTNNINNSSSVHSKLRPNSIERNLSSSFDAQSSFTPSMILNILPRMMNTVVVLLVDKGFEISQIEQALKGYCALHRLFIALVQHFPELKTIIFQKLKNFIEKSEFRHKKSCRNLGELVPLLSVCEDVGWTDLVVSLTEEGLTRAVLWIAKKSTQFAELVRERSQVPRHCRHINSSGRQSSSTSTTSSATVIASTNVPAVERPLIPTVAASVAVVGPTKTWASAIGTSFTSPASTSPSSSSSLDRSAQPITATPPPLPATAVAEELTVENAPLLSSDFLQVILNAHATAMKIYSFHCSFLRLLARPQGVDLPKLSRLYDLYYGLPTTYLLKSFVKILTKMDLEHLSTWNEYFETVCLKPVTQQQLSYLLLKCIDQSLSRGYHKHKTQFSKIHKNGLSSIMMKGSSHPKIVLCVDNSASMNRVIIAIETAVNDESFVSTSSTASVHGSSSPSPFADTTAAAVDASAIDSTVELLTPTKTPSQPQTKYSYVKEKLYSILQKQLSVTHQFNLVFFDEQSVHSLWPNELRIASKENIQAALDFCQQQELHRQQLDRRAAEGAAGTSGVGLGNFLGGFLQSAPVGAVTGGMQAQGPGLASSDVNFMSALTTAFITPKTEAVYLFSDGDIFDYNSYIVNKVEQLSCHGNNVRIRCNTLGFGASASGRSLLKAIADKTKGVFDNCVSDEDVETSTAAEDDDDDSDTSSVLI